MTPRAGLHVRAIINHQLVSVDTVCPGVLVASVAVEVVQVPVVPASGVAMWIADSVLMLAIAWRFYADRWGSLNAYADMVEQGLPRVFRFEKWGNPITWIHHTIWAALLTGAGAAIGWALGDWHEGARHFATIAAGFYVVREWLGFWQAGRFSVDGWMDQVGPVALAVALWVL